MDTKLSLKDAGFLLAFCLIVPIVEMTGLLAMAGVFPKFWPWLVVVVASGVVLAIVSWLIRFKVGQVIIVFIPAVCAGLATLLMVPWGWLAWTLAATVFAMLCGAASATCHTKAIRRAGFVIGIQALWIAPLAISIYTYSYLGPGTSVLPFTIFIVGGIAAIHVSER